MKNIGRSILFLATIFLLAAAPEVRARLMPAPAVLIIASVKVKGDGPQYLKKLLEGKPIMLRLGAKSFRVFATVIDGKGTGQIVSISEYQHAEAWGRFHVAAAHDEAFKKWLRDLAAALIEDTRESSLLEEVQP